MSSVVAFFGGPLVLLAVWLLVKLFLSWKRELIELPPKPKNNDEYMEKRRNIHATYEKAMDHYDKTLLWASGGAFVVSFSAVQFLSKRPDGSFAAAAGSSVHLLLGWGLLLLSVIIEIGAPYATTRMAVYSKTALTALHEGDEKRAVTEKKKSEAWGKLTKYHISVYF